VPTTGYLSLVLLASAVVLAAGPAGPPRTAGGREAAPPTPLRLLVVTHTAGFRHDSIPAAEDVITRIGERTRLFRTDLCRTADDVRRLLTRDALRDVDAVFFANTTGNLGIPDVDALLDWVRSGHGFVGAHSAADTYHDEPRFLEMLGGQFRAHGRQVEVEVRVENRDHPAVVHLAPRFRVLDEIYHFTRNNRGEVTMLLSLDRHPMDGLPGEGTPGDLPLAWAKEYGAGRVVYTALGHREDVWRNPAFQEHLAGAIRWVLQR
jgi:type 1 glutamine amidotransferase